MGFMKHLSGSLYGDILGNTSIAGFTLTETAYVRSLKLPKHSHEQAYFCFVLGGSFTEVYGEHSRSGRPSTLIFHPAGEIHSDHFHTTSRCFNIQMNTRWLERAQQPSRTIDTPADFCGGQLANLAARLYREFRQLDEFSGLAVEGLALEIMAEASRCSLKEPGRTPPHWLAQVRDILHEQLGERPTLVTLAESVDVHPVHLAREFRRFYRCTIGEYVRQSRIEFACRQISTSDASLSDIALAAGFFDHSHFARTFKTHMGMTPNQYRTALHPR
jgi:AraC family transcriptional regulator